MTYHNTIFNLFAISEGIIIKIFQTLEKYIDKTDHQGIQNALETLSYLEESDSIFSKRIKANKNKIVTRPLLHMSPDATKELFSSSLNSAKNKSNGNKKKSQFYKIDNLSSTFILSRTQRHAGSDCTEKLQLIPSDLSNSSEVAKEAENSSSEMLALFYNYFSFIER